MGGRAGGLAPWGVEPGWQLGTPVAPAPHSSPPSRAVLAPRPPAWQPPNIGKHHRFTKGILRGKGKGCKSGTKGEARVIGKV